MTVGRTGLAARSRSPLNFLFTRDRTDGGGGGDDDNDVDDTGTDDDDDSDDTDDTDDDDADDDDDGKPDAKLGDAGKRALKAERDKVKDLRKQLRELRSSKGKDGADKDGKDDGKDERDEDADQAAALVLAKPVIIRSAATAALKEAGLIGEPGRLVRLLDLKTIDVELDDDGEPDIDGLDDQIEDLVKDYPQLFAKKRTGAGSINGADRSRRDNSPKAKSATERQAAGLLGRGSR